MPELLIELFSEEIPAGMQQKAADDLRQLVTNALVEAGLTYEGAQAHGGARRLVLSVEGLDAKAADVNEERKGPRVDAPQQAIEGFLKSTGLEPRPAQGPGRQEGPVLSRRHQQARPHRHRDHRRRRARHHPQVPLAQVHALGLRLAALGAPAAFHRLHLRRRSRALRDRRHPQRQRHPRPPLHGRAEHRGPPLRGLCPQALTRTS